MAGLDAERTGILTSSNFQPSHKISNAETKPVTGWKLWKGVRVGRPEPTAEYLTSV